MSKVIDLMGRISELTGTDFPMPAEPGDSLPVRITLVGQPQQNLFGILNSIFGGAKQLDRALMRGYHCEVSFGESEKTVIVYGDEYHEVTYESLADSLCRLDRTGIPVICELTYHLETLKKFQVQIIASDNDFEEVDWEKVLMDSDYCLFTLSSTALLAMSERKVLRNCLLPNIKDALGIVLTNDHLILDDDRADIDASLEKFFGGNVPFFRIPEEKEGAILKKMEELADEMENLRELRKKRTEKILLSKAAHEVELQIEALSSNSERLDEAIELLKEKARLLPARKESACRRARMQYTSKMKVDAAERLSRFHRALMEKIRDEVSKGEDVAEMQSILPPYIGDQWNEESEKVLKDIRISAEEMQRDLNNYVEKDIRSYIESGADAQTADYVFRITDMYFKSEFHADENTFNFEEKKDDTKLKQCGVIASGIALVLISHPIIGAAVAVYGSHKVKQLGKKAFIETNRQSLVTASEDMCGEIYDDMIVWIDGIVASIEKNLMLCIEECYQKMMDTMVQALNSRKSDQSDYAGQNKALADIREEIKNAME